MTVTTTVKWRYKIYTSDETGAGTILAELVEAIANDGIAAERVVYINSSTKIIIVEVGR